MLNHSDLIGKEINGRYRILKRLGGGGTGEVYTAENIQLKTIVAIKLLPAAAAESPAGSRARLEQEARAAAELYHPNIVTVTDIGTLPDGSAFVVMDHFLGDNLAEILAAQGPLSIAEVVNTFIQIAEGLAHAHSNGILHRDIKPSNIMLSEDRQVAKLIDFGGSQSISGINEQDFDPGGSPYYMSPEQCRGEKLDERSDIYSLGCSMYEALTGKPPFIGDTVMGTIYKRTQERAPRLSKTANLEYPAQLERIVGRCLETAPAQRFRSASELQEELCNFQMNKNAGVTNPLSGFSQASLNYRAAIAILLPLVIGFAILVCLCANGQHLDLIHRFWP